MQAIIKYFKIMCQTPNIEMLALRELEEAKRKLLQAETGRDYATNMVKYNQERIYRLSRYLTSLQLDARVKRLKGDTNA